MPSAKIEITISLSRDANNMTIEEMCGCIEECEGESDKIVKRTVSN